MKLKEINLLWFIKLPKLIRKGKIKKQTLVNTIVVLAFLYLVALSHLYHISHTLKIAEETIQADLIKFDNDFFSKLKIEEGFFEKKIQKVRFEQMQLDLKIVGLKKERKRLESNFWYHWHKGHKRKVVVPK